MSRRGSRNRGRGPRKKETANHDEFTIKTRYYFRSLCSPKLDGSSPSDPRPKTPPLPYLRTSLSRSFSFYLMYNNIMRLSSSSKVERFSILFLLKVLRIRTPLV